MNSICAAFFTKSRTCFLSLTHLHHTPCKRMPVMPRSFEPLGSESEVFRDFRDKPPSVSMMAARSSKASMSRIRKRFG